jgi:hypothetical protein
MEVSLDLHDPERRTMGTNCARTAGQSGDPGATARDNRLLVEAVLWIARTGAPWRIYRSTGNWFTVLHAVLALGAKKAHGSGFQGFVG